MEKTSESEENESSEAGERNEGTSWYITVLLIPNL